MLSNILDLAGRFLPRDCSRGGAETLTTSFHSDHYLRHNARRLEHLASLRIPVAGQSVLEVGAGIGDHSHYFIDRGCDITITEARADSLVHLRRRYPQRDVALLDMESPLPPAKAPFDIVHCYGLLYHLARPEEAIAFMGGITKRMLFLETCVSFGDDENPHLTAEPAESPTQAVSGIGCRPTRPWLFKQLGQHFPFVYIPTTQPWHEEFPLDWSAPLEHRSPLQRAVFIASKVALEHPLLSRSLLVRQTRHE